MLIREYKVFRSMRRTPPHHRHERSAYVWGDVAVMTAAVLMWLGWLLWALEVMP